MNFVFAVLVVSALICILGEIIGKVPGWVSKIFLTIILILLIWGR